jgi:hypothetical protein
VQVDRITGITEVEARRRKKSEVRKWKTEGVVFELISGGTEWGASGPADDIRIKRKRTKVSLLKKPYTEAKMSRSQVKKAVWERWNCIILYLKNSIAFERLSNY